MAKYGGVDEFLEKIAWEGGVDMALDYGLTTDGYDLPEDMKTAWDSLVVVWNEYKPQADQWWSRFGSEDYE